MLLSLLCLALLPGIQDPPSRRALLVGIGDYPVADWPRLEGPPGDVRAVRAALLERGGFAEDEVQMLLGSAATRTRILTAWQQLAADAGPGDLILFYFAGHGSWLPDDDGDERTDGVDETLVPWDALNADGQRQDLRDDRLRAFITEAGARGAEVVVLLDCCHSGTAVRGASAVARQVPGPVPRGLGGVRPGGAETRIADASLRSAEAVRIDPIPTNVDYVLLAACRADQSAAELKADPDSPLRQGLFSWALTRSLALAPPGTTYREWMDATRRLIHGLYPRQTPLIEGPAQGQLVFGTGLLPQRQFFSLFADSEDPAVPCLHGGSLHGLTPGTELQVEAVGNPGPSADGGLGSLQVVSTTLNQARCSWITAPLEVAAWAGARAFVVRTAASSWRLPLGLAQGEPPPAAALSALRRKLDDHPVLDFRPRPGDAMQLQWQQGRWSLLDPRGEALPLSAAGDDPEAMARFALGLALLARSGRLQQVVHEDAVGLPFETTFETTLPTSGKVPNQDPFQRDAVGRAFWSMNDRLRASLRNRADQPIYASLLLFSPDGEINVLWTTETEDDAIAPGSQRTTPWIELFIPPRNADFYVEGNCVLRWVVTRQWHDLRGLAQPAATAVQLRRKATPLPGGVVGGVVGAPVDDWCTRSYSFVLRATDDGTSE